MDADENMVGRDYFWKRLELALYFIWAIDQTLEGSTRDSRRIWDSHGERVMVMWEGEEKEERRSRSTRTH